METSTLETNGLRKQTRVDFGKVTGIAIKLLVLIALLGGVAYTIYNRGEEIAFALVHADIVREVRMVYQSEHEQADKNIINRQRYEFVSPVPGDVTNAVKK